MLYNGNDVLLAKEHTQTYTLRMTKKKRECIVKMFGQKAAAEGVLADLGLVREKSGAAK